MGKGIKIPVGLILKPPIASDSFVRGNGALGVTDGLGHAEANGGGGKTWVFDAGVWTIATNKAKGTPAEGAPIMGGDTLNGNMETGDPPTGWNPLLGSVLDGVADERTGGAGAQSCEATRGTDATVGYRSAATTVGIWYKGTAWLKNISGTAAYLQLAGMAYGDTSGYAGPTWAQTVKCDRATGVSCIIRLGIAGAVNNVARFDDFIVAPLTLSSLFSSLQAGTTNCKVRAKISALTTGTQAGVVARLDIAAAPANFIIAYMDGTNVKIDECVAGVYAALGTAAKAFAADGEIELHLSGTAWRCYHITSAGVATLIASGVTNVVTGNLHGLFSTYTSNTFGGFQCWSTGDEGQYAALDDL